MAREMKNSGIVWIGAIPSEWNVSTLGKFISIDSGISVGKKYEAGTPIVEVPYLRVANVQGDHLDLSNIATIQVTPKEAEKYKLKAGQLLMTEGGDRDKLGRGCLWNGEIENCIHQNHVFSVQTDDRLTVRYLDYLTSSEVARTYFDVTAKKTTNLACTSKSIIQKFVIPIPCVDEQKAISKYLDAQCSYIDLVLKKVRKSIDEYKKLKQAIITKAITKGTRGDRTMKESGIEWVGKIPNHWGVRRIKTLFSVRDERNSLPLSEINLISLYTDKGVVQHADLEKTTGNKASTADGYKKVYENDIIVNIILCWMGAIGRSAYEGVTSPAYDIYVPSSEVECQFYHYYFRTAGFSGDCYKRGKGIMAMRWRTYSDQFRDIPVVCPPLEEQQAIVKYLDEMCSQIDILISKKEKAVSELESYKKSLIYEYVTGKKEVPNVT